MSLATILTAFGPGNFPSLTWIQEEMFITTGYVQWPFCCLEENILATSFCSTAVSNFLKLQEISSLGFYQKQHLFHVVSTLTGTQGSLYCQEPEQHCLRTRTSYAHQSYQCAVDLLESLGTTLIQKGPSLVTQLKHFHSRNSIPEDMKQ
jgi:hypothetical protein